MIGARFFKALGGIRTVGYAIAGVLFCEIGARVAVPTPDTQALTNATQFNGLLGLYNRFAGGATARGSMLALGVMPYLSARLFMALAGRMSSTMHEMSKNAVGRKALVKWTRALTTLLALIQSYGFARFTEQVPGVVAQPGLRYIAQTMLLLTTGALFMMWLCEHILAPSADEEAAEKTSEAPGLLAASPFDATAPAPMADTEPIVVRRT